jgi:hypothetical protein
LEDGEGHGGMIAGARGTSAAPAARRCQLGTDSAPPGAAPKPELLLSNAVEWTRR